DAHGYSALELKRQAQLADAMLVYHNRLLDFANIGWLVLPPSSPQSDAYDPHRPLLNLAASSPLMQRTFVLPNTPTATALRLVSALEHAPKVRQGEVVARVVLRDAQGNETTIPIRAGIETAEWALERGDVKGSALHQAAPIARSFRASDDFSPAYTRHL